MSENELIDDGAEATEALHAYLQKKVNVRYNHNGKTRTMQLPRLGVTYQYDIFMFLNENREVGTHRKLDKAMEEYGFLPHFHLIVCYDKEAKKLDVIDGQHRLAYAIENGLPVTYWVVDDPKDNPIPTLNTTQKKWPQKEYLNHWIALGKKHYTTLKKFYEDEALPLGSCINLLSGRRVNASGGGGNSLSDAFEDGSYKVDAEALVHAKEVGHVVNLTRPHFPAAPQRTFIAAISDILRAYPDFDVDHWKSKLESPGFTKFMVPTTEIDTMVKNISGVYDYRMQLKVNLYLQWQNWCEARKEK